MVYLPLQLFQLVLASKKNDDTNKPTANFKKNTIMKNTT